MLCNRFSSILCVDAMRENLHYTTLKEKGEERGREKGERGSFFLRGKN